MSVRISDERLCVCVCDKREHSIFLFSWTISADFFHEDIKKPSALIRREFLAMLLQKLVRGMSRKIAFADRIPIEASFRQKKRV